MINLIITNIRTYRNIRDDSLYGCLKILFKFRGISFWIALAVDIEPRISQVEFFRGQILKDGLKAPLFVFSTHPFKRFQTFCKLKVIQIVVNIMSHSVGFITTDGFSNLNLVFKSNNIFLITTWFNEPEESELFWKGRLKSSSFESIVEYFPIRPSVSLTNVKGFVRRDQNFNFLTATKLEHHFPTKPMILFAGDINIALRPHAVAYQDRLKSRYGEKIDLDEFLWSHAEYRLNYLNVNQPFKVSLKNDDSFALSVFETDFLPSEVELDGLRLTLHGRERFLYINAIVKSDLSENLVLIGSSWEQFWLTSRFVDSRKRFPSSSNVDELQRSRICPDFGSTLGSMPQNVRAEILASRSIGLIQRRDPVANPFLIGLEAERTFNSLLEFINVSRKLMSTSDNEIYRQAELIRSNYETHRILSTDTFIKSANEQMSKHLSFRQTRKR
jgi:hypothetical protein